MNLSRVLSLLVIAVTTATPVLAQKPTAPAAATAPSVGTPMKPGLWETTVVVQAAGTDDKRTVVSRYCFHAGDVGDVARVLPRQREPGLQCSNGEAKVQGAGVTWQITCTSPEGSLAGPAELSVTPTAYTGKAELERKKRGGKAEKVSEALSGKWIEACK